MTVHVARSLRVAGYLAILFGAFGAVAGLAGAGTFIPFRDQSTFQPALAEGLTVIAALGVVASVVGIVAGWGLLRGRTWAWSLAAFAAVACVGLNAAMTGIWGDYLPFLVLVGLAYGLELLLLVVGSGSRVRRTVATSPG